MAKSTEKCDFRFLEQADIKGFSDHEWQRFDQEMGWEWDKRTYYLAAFFKSDIVGYIELDILGGVGFIKELIVKKEFRGKSVGTQLMEMAEQYCEERGCHKLQLKTVPKRMKAATELYKKCGFKIEATLKNDKFGEDWVVFVKTLKKKYTEI